MKAIINQEKILNFIKEAFLNSNQNSNYTDYEHGLTTNDENEFLQLLSSVKSNDSENKTEFPDFISEIGFIEHFHVTSGESNKKGYDITKEESKIQKEHINLIQSKLSDSLEKIKSSFTRGNDSIENFHKSFKTCWEDHINHLNKYTGNKHISCFLISSDDNFEIREHPNDKNDLYFGNLGRENKKDFCLAYDYELLDYIYNYRNQIDYVIYYNKNKNKNNIEIIKVSNIPAIKEYLSNYKWDLISNFSMEIMTTNKI